DSPGQWDDAGRLRGGFRLASGRLARLGAGAAAAGHRQRDPAEDDRRRPRRRAPYHGKGLKWPSANQQTTAIAAPRSTSFSKKKNWPRSALPARRPRRTTSTTS